MCFAQISTSAEGKFPFIGIPIQLSVAIISHMPFDPVYGDRLARLLLETVA